MSAIKVSALALCGILVGVFPEGRAFAAEFTCAGLVLTRTPPGRSVAEQHAFSSQTRLHLSIDQADPGRSKMYWTGDPTMESLAPDWPQNTHMIAEHDIIAASFAASKGGISSVGSLTIDARGAFRTTESTLLREGVLFDVLDGTCQKDPE